MFRCLSNAFLKSLQYLRWIRTKRHLLFCAYWKYCLEDSPGNKDNQPDILMQFGVKKSRFTLAICSVAKTLPFRDD